MYTIADRFEQLHEISFEHREHLDTAYTTVKLDKEVIGEFSRSMKQLVFFPIHLTCLIGEKETYLEYGAG